MATNLNGRIAVVTGASIGIGKEISERLVKLGMKVVGCARNEAALKEIAKEINLVGPGEMFPHRCDVTSESDVLALFAFVKEKFGTLHVCVNNAGLGHNASLLSGSTSDWKQMLDVNVLGLCMCTREAFKIMESAGVDDGHFVHINSISGHRIVGTVVGAFYAATKYAIRALTEGLRQELRAKNNHIRTTAISPGLVETDFVYRLKPNEPEEAKKIYSSIKCLQPSDIADAVVFALQSPSNMDVNDILLRPTEQAL